MDMLSALVRSLKVPPSLSELCLAASCLLPFSAFLRYDKLAKLRCCDITFSKLSMSIYISASKTDQFRQGDSVVVVQTNSLTCPATMMERYFAQTELSHSSSLLLFQGITRTKRGEWLQPAGGWSYTRTCMRELFIVKWKELGYDPKQFGLHSLWAGGAIAAANAGMPDRLFKRHGCWRSETAKDGYIKDNVKALMSVSKSLEL